MPTITAETMKCTNDVPANNTICWRHYCLAAALSPLSPMSLPPTGTIGSFSGPAARLYGRGTTAGSRFLFSDTQSRVAAPRTRTVLSGTTAAGAVRLEGVIQCQPPLHCHCGDAPRVTVRLAAGARVGIDAAPSEDQPARTTLRRHLGLKSRRWLALRSALSMR